MFGSGLPFGLAHQFWQEAGGTGGFPRDIARAALYALPLGIFYFPRLRLRDAWAWLKKRGINLYPAGPDRPLRGCLVARKGSGLLLIDGHDAPDEQRFTIAHEVAHFLLEYQLPRERVVRKLGTDALEVLDGLRPPTVAERVDALLADAPLGVHTHLMDRASNGGLSCGAVLRAECQADFLALELLAPASEIWRKSRHPPDQPFDALVRQLSACLTEVFGLPEGIAKQHARRLALDWTGGPSVREWLGLP